MARGDSIHDQLPRRSLILVFIIHSGIEDRVQDLTGLRGSQHTGLVFVDNPGITLGTAYFLPAA